MTTSHLSSTIRVYMQLAWLEAFNVPLLVLTGCRFLPRRLRGLDHLEPLRRRTIGRWSIVPDLRGGDARYRHLRFTIRFPVRRWLLSGGGATPCCYGSNEFSTEKRRRGEERTNGSVGIFGRRWMILGEGGVIQWFDDGRRNGGNHIWCEPCWVNLKVKRCWWFIRLSFGRKRKKRRKYLSQKLFVGDRIPLLKIKKYNLETELEHCKSIDTTNSRKLFPTSLEIRIILIKMWVIARFIRDSARNYDSIEISFYLHEMKMYNRIKNGVKVRGVNEGDGGEKKNVFPFCSVSSVSKSSTTLEKRHMKMTKL